MPIGFWAISREEVKELYQHCGNGQAPSREALNKLVRDIKEALDDKLEEVIFLATQRQRRQLP